MKPARSTILTNLLPHDLQIGIYKVLRSLQCKIATKLLDSVNKVNRVNKVKHTVSKYTDMLTWQKKTILRYTSPPNPLPNSHLSHPPTASLTFELGFHPIFSNLTNSSWLRPPHHCFRWLEILCLTSMTIPSVRHHQSTTWASSWTPPSLLNNT